MLVSQRWKWLSGTTSGNLADWKSIAAPLGSCHVWSMEESKNEKVNQAHVLFDRFVQASTCKGTLKAFQELCDYLELKPKDYRSFYHKLKSKLNYWKAKALWAKLDKRGSHKDYKKGKACANTKVRASVTMPRQLLPNPSGVSSIKRYGCTKMLPGVTVSAGKFQECCHNFSIWLAVRNSFCHRQMWLPTWMFVFYLGEAASKFLHGKFLWHQSYR